MRGHLYCSTRCAREAGRAAWRDRILKQLARPVPSRAAVAIVAAALAAPTLTALRTVSELDKLNAPSAATRRRPIPAAHIDTVAAAGPAVRISGTAPEGSAVFLFAGNRFVGTTFAEGGSFHFDEVRATGPFRVGAMFLSPGAAYAPTEADGSLPSTIGQPPPPSLPSLAAVPDVTRGPADRPEIVLSFDGGSSDRGAREILDALRARGIRTTMFLTGDFIRQFPGLTRQIAADGHEVGNHTGTHPHLTTYAEDGRQATRPGVDRAYLVRELDTAAGLYRETTGRDMAPLWRAPFGEQNAEIRRWAAQAGYWHVGWTGGRAGLDGLDWVSDPRSPAFRSSDRVVARLVTNAENGGIVLLHLGSDRDDPVALRVPALLDGLTQRGFRLVRASDLLAREGLTAQRLAQLASQDTAGH
jgi:peptidoglycan/xylan/chitin deacetylase (PgdA/CDA1 family)